MSNETSWPSQSSTDSSPNKTSWLFPFPPEIFQIITEFLTTKDIHALSQTCRTLYSFFNNDNFWIDRICSQFPRSVVQLYTSDLFQEPEIVPTYNEIRSSGFAHVQSEAELDRLAIDSATHYNDEAIEKRHAKMYVSKENFLNEVEFYQFNKPTNGSEISLMKMIYFYLIDRKQCAAVDMSVIHLNDYHLVEEDDASSLIGRIIHLQNVCWLQITGRFEHKIMPGKYEVSWRLKGDENGINIGGETEFIVLPQHGKLLNYRITEADFRDLATEHGDQWFIVKMGQIIIYEPSNILVAVRNWNNPYWKSGLSWDCIELTIAS